MWLNQNKLETNFHPVPQNIHGTIYILICISLLLLAWIFYNYRNQTYKIFSAALSEKQKNNLIREDSESIKKVTRLLNVTFFINFFILFYAINFRYKLLLINDNLDILIYFILILSTFVVKSIVNIFLAWVFETKILLQFYLKDNYLKFKLYSLLAIISAILILFSSNLSQLFTIIAITIFTILWIIRCYKAYKYSNEFKSFSILYAFLYICILEIIPVAVIGKFLMENA